MNHTLLAVPLSMRPSFVFCLGQNPAPWVGGKKRLLPVLIQSLPENIREMETYVKPFFGGGAPFF